MNSDFSDVSVIAELQSQYAAQPIFDVDKKRFAIELLQRNKSLSTSLTLVQTTADILALQCQNLTEYITLYRTTLFIRICPQLMLSGVSLPLDPAQVILMLAGPFQSTPELISAIMRWKKRGFKFVLDDCNCSENSHDVIALADIIRLDLLNSTLDDVEQYRALYSRPGLMWLAAQVETDEQLDACKALGCQLFQGYFLPNELIVAGKKIEPSALKLAEIIACLFVDEPDINKLAALLKDEPNIVMGMLNIANSPLYRKTRAVSSVKEIITRLGLALARKWLLTYAVLGSAAPAAAITVLTRAYSAQRIAEKWHMDSGQSQQYFLAALISGSDMLFGITSKTFLAQLNIHPAIKHALSYKSGRMADALTIIRGIERGYALQQPALPSELPYLSCYNIELAEVQKRLAEAGS